MIPTVVIDAFGLVGEPTVLAGGEGTSVLIGGVVCKPTEDPDLAGWCQEVASSPRAGAIRFPEPVRAGDGSFVVDGWTASEFIADLQSLEDDARAVVELADAVTAELSGAARALPARSDRWALGIEAAYGSPLEGIGGAAHEVLAVLVDRAGRPPERDAIVHADMTGNTFVTPQGTPVVLDLSPARASVGFAAAVVVADHLLWRDGHARLIELTDPAELLRALAFRMVAEQLAGDPRHGARLDDYRTLIDRITP